MDIRYGFLATHLRIRFGGDAQLDGGDGGEFRVHLLRVAVQHDADILVGVEGIAGVDKFPGGFSHCFLGAGAAIVAATGGEKQHSKGHGCDQQKGGCPGAGYEQTSVTLSIRLATLMPSFSMTIGPGAEAPKRSMPMETPSSPT